MCQDDLRPASTEAKTPEKKKPQENNSRPIVLLLSSDNLVNPNLDEARGRKLSKRSILFKVYIRSDWLRTFSRTFRVTKREKIKSSRPPKMKGPQDSIWCLWRAMLEVEIGFKPALEKPKTKV